MNVDKPHYYDGKLYEKLIDPALKEIRDIIIEQIEAGSSVVDIGCGTGALVFDLAKHCKSATGIELSSKMVAHAEHRKQAEDTQNVNFIHGDATNLPDIENHQFDYAVISMVIHEMPPELRGKVLQEAKRIAKKIIIADYAVPQPFNLAGIGVRIVEFLAGIEHFRGFRDFQKNNGIDQLLANCQFSIYSEAKNQDGTIRVVMAQ